MGDSNRSDQSYQWTAQEIRERLGTSTVLFPRDRLLQAEDIARVREAGIKHMEIIPHFPAMEYSPGHMDFDNQAHLSEIVSECEKQGVQFVSMHSPNYLYHSEDEAERKNAVAEGVRAAKVATDMGAGIMVCHFQIDEPSERSATEMLAQLDGYSFKLAIEDLDKPIADYVGFVDRIGSDRMGMVIDTGHTMDDDGINPFTHIDRARKTMAMCGKRLISLHLHDFTYKWKDGDHLAPLTASLEWAEVFAAFKDIDYQGVFMFESVFPPDKQELTTDYVLDKVGTFPEAFVERYVN